MITQSHFCSEKKSKVLQKHQQVTSKHNPGQSKIQNSMDSFLFKKENPGALSRQMTQIKKRIAGQFWIKKGYLVRNVLHFSQF